MLLLLSYLQGSKKDKFDECGEWKTCCAGGDGSGALCGTLDCEPGASICKGHWMTDNCPQTCNICMSTIRYNKELEIPHVLTFLL